MAAGARRWHNWPLTCAHLALEQATDDASPEFFPTFPDFPSPQPLSKIQPRECQPCTACCDGWLQIQVEGKPVYPGRPCHHSTGSGCDDYANRPEDPCVHFVCGWRMDGSPLPDWMKPNNAKVVVLFDQSQWRGLPLDVAVPVGRRIPPRALNWLQDFAMKNQRVLVYSEQHVENGKFSNRQAAHAFGPPEFQQDVAARMQQGLPLW